MRAYLTVTSGAVVTTLGVPSNAVLCVQVLSLKSIQFTITDKDFDAIAGLEELQEIVLDCDQPPEGQGQTDEAKWGLLHFPEAMKQLTNMTHLTLSCHYGITALPQGISRLNKLEVSCPAPVCVFILLIV